MKNLRIESLVLVTAFAFLIGGCGGNNNTPAPTVAPATTAPASCPAGQTLAANNTCVIATTATPAPTSPCAANPALPLFTQYGCHAQGGCSTPNYAQVPDQAQLTANAIYYCVPVITNPQVYYAGRTYNTTGVYNPSYSAYFAVGATTGQPVIAPTTTGCPAGTQCTQ